MAEIANVEIEQDVSIETLQPHPENPRQGDVGAISESLEAHGFYGTVVAQRSTGRILAGNHRYLAARALGLTSLPVAWLDVDDDEALRILLADNRTGDLASYDNRQLADLLTALAEASTLEGTGYTGDDLDDLLFDLERGNRFRPDTAPVSMLAAHPRNYRTHPPEQIAHLAMSIEQHGFFRNVVTARDGTILAGHGIVAAARELGRSRVPVVRLDLDPFEPKALSILVADNEIEHGADVDDRELTELLRGLAETDDLVGTGFDEQQLAALAMVTRPASEISDFSEAGEWLGLPGFEQTKFYPQLRVKFENVDDRDRFVKLAGIDYIYKVMNGHWTIWWPERKRDDLASVKFEVEDVDDA